MLPLLSAYLLLLTLGVLRRHGCQMATAIALLANWAINTLFVSMVGDPYPWLFFIVTDWLTGIAILAVYCSRWQGAVISIYAAQIICHVAYGLGPGDAWAEYHGWWRLYYLAWAQALFVGGWIGYEGARHSSWLSGRVSSAFAFARRRHEP